MSDEPLSDEYLANIRSVLETPQEAHSAAFNAAVATLASSVPDLLAEIERLRALQHE